MAVHVVEQEVEDIGGSASSHWNVGTLVGQLRAMGLDGTAQLISTGGLGIDKASAVQAAMTADMA